MHLVNIRVVCAEKELVWTECNVAFAVTGCTKDVAVLREDCAIYPILSAPNACSRLGEMIQTRRN